MIAFARTKTVFAFYRKQLIKCFCLLLAFYGLEIATAFGQSPKNIDSLTQALEHASLDKKPDIYKELCYAYYMKQQYQESLLAGKKGLAIAEQVNDLFHRGALSISLGNVYLILGQFDSAGYFFEEGYKYNTMRGDSIGIGKALIVMSNFLGRRGLYDSSITVLTKAISILNQTNDSLDLGLAYSNLGNRYSSKGNYVKALAAYQKALSILEEIGEFDKAQITQLGMGNAYTAIGDEERALFHYQKARNAYAVPMSDHSRAILTNNIGSLMVKKKRFREAKPYLLEAFSIWGRDDSNCFAIYPLGNLGEVYTALNMRDSAIFFLDQSIKKAEKCNEPYVISSSLLILSKNYIESSPQKAKSLLDRAYRLAVETGKKDVERDASFLLYDYYKRNNNYAQALNYYEKFKALSDSLVNEETTKKIARMEADFEYEQEKKEMEWAHQQEVLNEQLKLKRQKQTTNIVLIGVAVLLILVLLIYRSYRIKRQANRELALKNAEITRQKTELEIMNKTKEKLLSVLSHDLKNPLFGLEGTLHMFLQGALPQDRLQQYVRDLQVRLHNTSDFLENLLQWTKGQLAGIKPGKTSFAAEKVVEDTLNLLDPAAKAKQLLIIPVISSGFTLHADYEMTKVVLRNLITNAIKFSPAGESITVSLNRLEQEFIFSVHDNGAGIQGNQKDVFSLMGFSKRGTQGEVGSGLGLMLCQEFVEKQGGRIWFESKEGEGTTFYFTLPVYTEETVEA